jgi:hypothetical protein
MKSASKPVALTIAAVILWITAIYFFTIVAPWTTAIEPDLLPSEVRTEGLNSKWVAAVNEHGVWQQWERGTISQRSAFFVAHVAALVCCAIFAFVLGFRASKIRKAEQDADGNPH